MAVLLNLTLTSSLLLIPIPISHAASNQNNITATEAATDSSVRSFKTHPTWSRVLQRALGLNISSRLLATKVGESLLNKELKGELDLNLTSYSALDLLSKRLKQVEFTGSHLQHPDIPTIQNLHIISDESTPLAFNTKTKRLQHPLVLHLSATITEDDLNTFLKALEADNKLDIQVPLPPFKHREVIELNNTSISFQEDTLQANTEASIQGAPTNPEGGVHIHSHIRPKLAQGQLDITDLQLSIPQISAHHTQSIETFLKNTLPELVNLNTFINIKHHRSRITYQQLRMNDHQLTLNADLSIHPK